MSCLVQGSPLESEAFMGCWSGRHISTLRTAMIIEAQHPDVHHLARLASPFIAHEQNTINQQHSKSKDWQKPPGGRGLCVNTCCTEGHATLLSVRVVSLGAINILQAIQKFHRGNPATPNFLVKVHCRCSHSDSA